MGSVIGAVTDGLGITDTESADHYADTADNMRARSASLSDRQIAASEDIMTFQQEEYQWWKDIYGTLQENLGDYYNNLDGDKLASLGLENQQIEFQKAEKAIQENYAQRGLADSGMAIADASKAELYNASARAGIRTSADDMANQQKMQFLSMGINQGTQMQGIINNAEANVNTAYTTGVNAATSLTNNYVNNQTALTTANMAQTATFWDNIMDMGGMAAGMG